MQSVAIKNPVLASALKATAYAVTGSRPVAIGEPVDIHLHGEPAARQPEVPGIFTWHQPPIPDIPGVALHSPAPGLFSQSHGSVLTSSRFGQKAVAVACGKNGIGNHTAIRLAHTDLKIPSFDNYRRPSTLDPTKRPDRDANRAFTYMISGTAIAGAVPVVKYFGELFLWSWSPSKDVLAMAKIEVNLNDIPAGKNVVLKWRGKPLFIKHRTEEDIARARAVDIATLRDPQKDEERVKDPKWLILLGVCTHLGCVPIAGQGDYGGYYCPCHGSHYDGSGRIRKGPAPLNLEIPPYEFQGDIVVVG